MLLQGGETPNEVKDSDRSNSQHRRSGYMKNNLGANPMHREGRALSALFRFGEKAKVSGPAWLRRVQHQQETMEPTSNRFLKTF